MRHVREKGKKENAGEMDRRESAPMRATRSAARAERKAPGELWGIRCTHRHGDMRIEADQRSS